MKKVTTFTLNACPDCRKMKLYLEVDTPDCSEQRVVEDVIAGYDIKALKAKLL